MPSEQSSERVERELLEARVTATNYMREWWPWCAKTEREHRTGIGWLADHVLNIVDLSKLLEIREAAQAVVDEPGGAVGPQREAIKRLREVLRS